MLFDQRQSNLPANKMLISVLVAMALWWIWRKPKAGVAASGEARGLGLLRSEPKASGLKPLPQEPASHRSLL
ncbi:MULTISPECIES: hypothetical protein [unclassified Lysobacter]|uniref:hypothetical protein n=1 Tax=unclassified Lysobacter TaxID=2635362 RepID=UPI001BEC6858|nr:MULTISPECIES: hypothetical protein [unclassified Lysobacter]MBT2746261.1 hypothetical protein [Lysobacter sp. ISL-42]MBT2751266.1 hypothetical protein [Lysobacter sp. ISL-50]MBT2775674.1 hypothetical protein [Lysobacter sp. ISL-54]MBT2780059.1 hypothetical protein [Lysobacter sp. ISL-52]